MRRALDDLGSGGLELLYGQDLSDGGRLPTNIGYPADLALANPGQMLYIAMEMSNMPKGELEYLAEQLRIYAGM